MNIAQALTVGTGVWFLALVFVAGALGSFAFVTIRKHSTSLFVSFAIFGSTYAGIDYIVGMNRDLTASATIAWLGGIIIGRSGTLAVRRWKNKK
jgi:hypothetical protein